MKHIGLLLLSFWAFSALAQISSKHQKAINTQVAQDYPYLEALYKHLHRNPELSFREKETASRMATELKKLGFEVTENFGGYGVVAVFKNGKGPTVMVRTDTDALPVKEQTGVKYASEVTTTNEQGVEVPVMHACGHDVHMASWVGTARALVTMKDQWKGTLMMIAQPAEERSGGAKAMLKEGLYEKFPVPDYALALHASASLPSGMVGYTSGYALANVDMVDITVYGEGGHGAYPHTTKDPIVLAARMVMALQTIVSREVSPLEPAVVTVGSIHGGTKGNVIPGQVKMELTLRSYSDEVRNGMLKQIERIINGVAQSAGISEAKMPQMYVRDEYTPAAYNDPELCKKADEAMTAMLGAAAVKELPPVMGGEDFGRYSKTEENVPGLLYWLGAVDPATYQKAQETGETLPSLHSPFFAPLPEPTLKTGVKSMTAAVLQLFGE